MAPPSCRWAPAARRSPRVPARPATHRVWWPGSPTPPARTCRWSARSTAPGTSPRRPSSSESTSTSSPDWRSARPRAARASRFVPYLEGERTPPLPYAKGELTGLDLSNFTPANIARAAIEGILWSLAYGLRTLAEHAGQLDRVILTGGAAQSRAVQEIAPAVLGLPVTVTAVEESVAIGAARQAAWALTGELPDWPVPQQRELHPSADRCQGRRGDPRALPRHRVRALHPAVDRADSALDGPGLRTYWDCGGW